MTAQALDTNFTVSGEFVLDVKGGQVVLVRSSDGYEYSTAFDTGVHSVGPLVAQDYQLKRHTGSPVCDVEHL